MKLCDLVPAVDIDHNSYCDLFPAVDIDHSYCSSVAFICLKLYGFICVVGMPLLLQRSLRFLEELFHSDVGGASQLIPEMAGDTLQHLVQSCQGAVQSKASKVGDTSVHREFLSGVQILLQ